MVHRYQSTQQRHVEGGSEARLRARHLKELKTKARFLNRVSLFSAAVFSVLIARTYPAGRGDGGVLLFAVVMVAVSAGLYLLTRRIAATLGGDPDEAEVSRWERFLSCYYYPSFIFRRKRNPFIVSDDEDV
ncbi:MAG: hypothetical protein GXO94_02410 [Nitrospirae bacterium]|nr:hypothetical protein [Nitrospirota bacterium]